MKYFGPCLSQALFRSALKPELPARPIGQLFKACAIQGAILFAAGCSNIGLEVPISATPLTISDAGTGIDKSQLCLLYKRFSLLGAAGASTAFGGLMKNNSPTTMT